MSRSGSFHPGLAAASVEPERFHHLGRAHVDLPVHQVPDRAVENGLRWNLPGWTPRRDDHVVWSNWHIHPALAGLWVCDRFRLVEWPAGQILLATKHAYTLWLVRLAVEEISGQLKPRKGYVR